MRVAVVYDSNGEFRVHAADCADVKRDERKYHDAAEVYDAANRHAVNLACWGDVASDNLASGSPEWEAECDSFAAAETVYLPCVGDLA